LRVAGESELKQKHGFLSTETWSSSPNDINWAYDQSYFLETAQIPLLRKTETCGAKLKFDNAIKFIIYAEKKA